MFRLQKHSKCQDARANHPNSDCFTPSAMRLEQTTPLERPKQTAPIRAPSAEQKFFQSKRLLGVSLQLGETKTKRNK